MSIDFHSIDLTNADAEILDLLCEGGCWDVDGLSTQTDLSLDQIENALYRMLEQGLVISEENTLNVSAGDPRDGATWTGWEVTANGREVQAYLHS